MRATGDRGAGGASSWRRVAGGGYRRIRALDALCDVARWGTMKDALGCALRCYAWGNDERRAWVCSAMLVGRYFMYEGVDCWGFGMIRCDPRLVRYIGKCI